MHMTATALETTEPATCRDVAIERHDDGCLLGRCGCGWESTLGASGEAVATEWAEHVGGRPDGPV